MGTEFLFAGMKRQMGRK